MPTTDDKRLRLVQDLLPESTVVVPTPGLVYHVQKLLEEHRGGPFRRGTRVVLVNDRGHADKVKGHDRVAFDPACDHEVGSNVAAAEIRKARDVVHALNRLAAE